MSEEIRAADAAVTALHEAQQEARRLSDENDRLVTLRDRAETEIGAKAQAERDYWRIQAQDVLTDLHAQAVELDAALAVVEAVRASVWRETAFLPIEKADMLALGRVLDALRAYDETVKARET